MACVNDGENVHMVVVFVTAVCLQVHMCNESVMCELLLESDPQQPDAPAAESSTDFNRAGPPSGSCGH